jgi:hypothetical protein
MSSRDELIEAGTQAVCAWDPDYDPADEDTRAAVGVVIDAVAPMIRTDERVGMGPLWRGGVAEVQAATLADLRAKVEALRAKAEVVGLSERAFAYEVVLKLIDGSSE